jgi:hypothetical protein
MSTPIARHADGSNCYTRNCSLGRHVPIVKNVDTGFAEFTRNIIQANPSVRDMIMRDIENKLNNNKKQVRDLFCKKSTRTIDTLDELGAQGTSKIATTYCPKHKRIHVLRKGTFDTAVNSLAQVHKLIPSDLDKDKLTELHNATRELIVAARQPYTDDREKLALWKISVGGGHQDLNAMAALAKANRNYELAKKQKIEKQRENQLKGQPVPSPAKKPRKRRLLMNPEEVTKEQLIQYYKCDRKVKHADENIAQKAVVTYVERHPDTSKGMGSYSCGYCNQYHIGHGDGNTSEERLLANAKRNWKMQPWLANRFVKRVVLGQELKTA